MRLIDADALKKVMIETLEALLKNPKMDNQEAHLLAAFHTVGKMIDDAPTADAVAVVRCKDCKFNNRCLLQHFVRDNAVEEITDEWFCADGKRQDENRSD